MNVLHDLKTSISRPSLNAGFASSGKPQEEHAPESSHKQQAQSSVSPSSSSSTVMQFKAPCLSETSLKSSSPSCTPEPDPFLISEPQSSAYWSGRFMSLYDKFMTEVLVPIPRGLAASHVQPGFSTSPKQATATKLVYHPTQLSHSTTTSALMDIACKPQSTTSRAQDEEEITRRVFRHLEFFCSTEEARASLYEWQQSYARLTKQPHLLPPKRPKAQAKTTTPRWFGGNGRRSFSALREAAAQRASGKRVVTEKPPQKGKVQAFVF